MRSGDSGTERPAGRFVRTAQPASLHVVRENGMQVRSRLESREIHRRFLQLVTTGYALLCAGLGGAGSSVHDRGSTVAACDVFSGCAARLTVGTDAR
jgi:hypothetical protein